MSEEELYAQPDWWGLPDRHGELHGLLGATLTGSDGQPVGMVMVTDKKQEGECADFSNEDETLLKQLSASASLALGQVTARQVAELHLGELDAIFASMNDGVVTFNMESEAVRVNERATRDFGLDPQMPDVPGMFDNQTIHYPDGKPVPAEERPYFLALRGIRTNNQRYHLQTKDGEKYITISSWPLMQGERINGAVSVWHDETEREQFLKHLEEEQAILEQRVQERTRDLQVEIEQRTQIEQDLRRSLEDLQEANQELDRQMEALAIASDALERARRTLELERRRYQDLFDLAPDGYLVTDLDGKILEANRAAGSILGYPHQRLTKPKNKFLVTFIAVQDRKDFRNQLNQLKQAIQLGRVYQTWEYQMEPQFGPPFVAELTVLAARSEENGEEKEPQLRWLIRDISNRKQVEEQVRQGARRTAALAEVSRAVVEAGYDYEGILEIVTRAAADLFGDICIIRTASTDREWLLLASYYNNDPVHTRSQNFELQHAHNIHDGLLGKVFTESKPVLIKDNPENAELNPKGKEAVQALKVGTMMVAPLRSHNQAFGVIEVARRIPCASFLQVDLKLLQTLADRVAQAITNVQLYQDLEHAYQEEQRMRAQLIQAEKHSALSRMVASVAHELNNPIQTIQNSLYLIQSDLPKTAELQEYLQMAVAEAKRVSTLVNQLRESYRPSQAGEKQIIELNQLLDKVEALLAPHLAHEKVSWRMEPKRNPVLVEAIPDQLKQVFLNLSLNAIEAMQPGGGVLDVSLQIDKSKKHAEVRFQDSGPGIPPEIQKKLFEPFFTTKTTGTGLGLSISYEIISNHGGDIRLVSNPGEGACFIVILPLSSG
jgi:PAS domain S-box-containing protein